MGPGEEISEPACRRVLVKRMGLDEARLSCIANADDREARAFCFLGLDTPRALERLDR